jgi:hypothetical protein
MSIVAGIILMLNCRGKDVIITRSENIAGSFNNFPASAVRTDLICYRIESYGWPLGFTGFHRPVRSVDGDWHDIYLGTQYFDIFSLVIDVIFGLLLVGLTGFIGRRK